MGTPGPALTSVRILGKPGRDLLVSSLSESGPSRDIAGIPRLLNVIHLEQRVLGRPIGDLMAKTDQTTFRPCAASRRRMSRKSRSLANRKK
jgi:hypothetical protein